MKTDSRCRSCAEYPRNCKGVQYDITIPGFRWGGVDCCHYHRKTVPERTVGDSTIRRRGKDSDIDSELLTIRYR